MFTLEYFIGLILIGVVAGFASGLLGVGGGFLIVPFQYFLLEYLGLNPSLAMLISLGTSLAIIIPTASSGAYRHLKVMDDILEPGIKLGLFGIVGGVIGGLIASILPTQILKIIFGCLLLFVAIRNLVLANKKDSKARIQFNIINIAVIGILVGISSGLLGIGGGIFLMVLLTSIFGFSMIKSIGISSIFISLTAIGGTVSYIISGWGINPFPFSLGYISLVNFIVIAMFSVPLAYYGAKIAHKLPEKRLKQVFGLVVLYISLKMLGILP
nr:sulfite exporter TauE/SafE family protein [uncultured Methanobrevibacter sp.]